MTDISRPGHGTDEFLIPPRSALQWLREGARTALFMKPRWSGMETGPALLGLLVLAETLLIMLLQRLYISGDAQFYWQAVTGGWFGLAASAWICYLVCRGDSARRRPHSAPGAAHLFTMSLAQGIVLALVTGLVFLLLLRSGMQTGSLEQGWAAWLLWLLPLLWQILAQLVLLWHGSEQRQAALAFAMLAAVGANALYLAARPPEYWYPVEVEESGETGKTLELTQELMEAQPRLLATALEDVAPQRPGRPDLYAITYAPYEGDVFRNESAMVSQVMAGRFDAEGRTLQLLNHAETSEALPWATPLNLQRAIRRFANVMDREEDILFIHLTSHGGQDGTLASYFWPMQVDELQPEQLRQWLDEAGIRHRVLSISACYSGSWIAPLAGEDTLVMTAADAEHTSYGCGRKSELTFFGRAMYDEQLRSTTLSFEEAHKEARKLIERREQEAGKTDGYSNPQISMGAKIRERLAVLQRDVAGRKGG